MSESIDYFSNHQLKLRFPWRLYHAPIVAGLEAAIRSAPGAEVLNVGSGPFLELSVLPSEGRRFTICDIDPRALDAARRVHGPKLEGAHVIDDSGRLPYPADRFDLVVAMDVIEHVDPPLPWLYEIMRVLRPGGKLYLTTPNYASRSLKFLEHTALELIARLQGFSRRGLHPTPLNPSLLSDLLARAGCVDVSIDVVSLGWVVAATARKPTANPQDAAKGEDSGHH